MRSLGSMLPFAFVAVACSSSADGVSVPSSAVADAGDAAATREACAAKALPASDEVSAAIAANLACNTAADCTTIAFSTRCFDACTRAVATSGRATVEQARSSASAGACTAFVDAGCAVEVPPCEPPSAPVCVAGKCA